MAWVAGPLRSGAVSLPRQFRMPLVYSDRGYEDRPRFMRNNEDWRLSPQELSTAMFVHRGCYYYAKALECEGSAYVPHGFRGALLAERLATMTLFCDPVQFPQAGPVPATKVLGHVAECFAQATTATIAIEGLRPSIAMEGIFLQRHRRPEEALDAALQFRSSAEGTQLRDWFSALLQVAFDGNVKGVGRRVELLKRVSEREAIRKFGTTFASSEVVQLVDLAGRLRPVLGTIFRMIPLEWQESLTKWLNVSHRRTGMQVLFSHYLSSKT